MTIQNITLLTAATATALIAGLLFAYSCSVNPGLARLPDGEYLSAMQSINKAILNPVFFTAFAGALLLLPLSTFLSYGRPPSRGFCLLAAASAIYAVGVFCVTAFGNVPLNEALARFDIRSASPAAIAQQRAAFEGPWNAFHTVRTIGAVSALLLVLLACFRNRQPA